MNRILALTVVVLSAFSMAVGAAGPDAAKAPPAVEPAKAPAAADLFTDAKRWRKMIDSGMALDNSWETRVGRYERLYQKIVKTKQEAAQPAIA